MRRTLTALGLEVYAVALALLGSANAVRTDEAKYLLDIPYPHPPLLRWILGLFDGWSGQEIFVRIFFATVVIQSVWMLWRVAKRLRPASATWISLLYLLSAGTVFHAGTVMMSVVTGWQFLMLLLLYTYVSGRRMSRSPSGRMLAAVTGFFWLCSLFMAYHVALAFPIVIAILWRCTQRWYERSLYLALPLALLALYSLTNPLALLRMIGTAGGEAVDLSMRFAQFGNIFLIAGSVMLAIIGIFGILRSRSTALIFSFLLVCAYILLARMHYQAIFLVPFFVVGCLSLPKFFDRSFFWRGFSLFAVTFFTIWLLPKPEASPARDVGTVLETKGYTFANRARIVGPFGHQWQYELPLEIVRDTPLLKNKDADVLICIKKCDAKETRKLKQLMKEPVEVWTK
jgi:hypothetical protein